MPSTWAQALEQALHVVLHLLQGGVGALRLLDAHDLDLVELMQTVQTSHVLAVRTGLTTEARSVGGHLLREVVVTKDDISEYVGDRNLGCRDEIEVIKTYIVHLGLLVRQLTGTETGSSGNRDFALYHADQYAAPTQGSYSTVQSVDGSTWYKQYAQDTVEKTPYTSGSGKVAYNESIVQKLPPDPQRKERM